MKLFKLILLFFTVTLLFSGCGSFYHYTVKPTPIKKDIAHFYINNVDVALHNLNTLTNVEAINQYPNEDKMALLFKDSFNNYLISLNRHCVSGENCYPLNIDINYERVFSLVSNSVSYPVYSFFVKVFKDDNKIAEFNRIELTLDRGMINGMGRFVKIGSANTNLDDEIEDINIIVKETVKEDILNIGD